SPRGTSTHAYIANAHTFFSIAETTDRRRRLKHQNSRIFGGFLCDQPLWTGTVCALQTMASAKKRKRTAALQDLRRFVWFECSRSVLEVRQSSAAFGVQL